MAGGLDRLEKRLDRLEKFFRKRKGSAKGTAGSVLSTPTKSDSIFRTFPQPSFIRPTSTRMLARDETSLNLRSAQRAHSLPESPSTPRLMSLTASHEVEDPLASALPAQPSTSSHGRGLPPRIPKRSSSLTPTRRPASLASLAELLAFSFANSDGQREITKPASLKSRSRSGSISPRAQANRKRHSDVVNIQHTTGQYQALTPPPSAEYDKSFDPAQLVFQKQLPAVPPPNELTPQPSPRLVPLPEPEADELGIDRDVGIQRPKSLDATSSFSKEAKVVLRKSLSFSTLAELKLLSKIDPILKEPTLSDFLSLSDDDIADGTLATQNQAGPASRPTTPISPFETESISQTEVGPLSQVVTPPRTNTPAQLSTVSKPPTCGLPPDPPVLASSPQISTGTRLLTLSPPLATRPATAAAFEAARIAAKYRFDLVYVVNLWPSGLARNSSVVQPPLPTTGPSIDGIGAGRPTSPSARHPRVALTGRLLAAYGLPYVMSPFRISASVHLKMLRSDGWLEYRCENGTPDEFSRGYSCSFYAAHISDGRGRPVEEGSSGAKPRRRRNTAPNRGIVFAAYRLPLADNSSVESDAAELETLRMDAETLVDMLIDMHMTQSKRRLVASQRCFASQAEAPGNALLAA